MTTTALVLELLAVLGGALALLRQAQARRATGARAGLVLLLVVGAAVLLRGFGIRDDSSFVRHVPALAVVCLVVLVPFLVVRFAAAVGALPARATQAAGMATTALVVGALLTSRFPRPEEHRSSWVTALALGALAAGLLQAVAASLGLLRNAQDQPLVVRRRLQALAVASLLLPTAALAGSLTSATAARSVASLVAAAATGLLVTAFVVPTWLRIAWRSRDLTRLGRAERELVQCVSVEEVARAVVPPLVPVFGAGGAALLGSDGTALASEGVGADDLQEVLQQLRARPRQELLVRTAEGGLACRLSEGWLVVRPGPFAAPLGTAELRLLDQVGAATDLALLRCRAREDQARTQRAADTTNAELQAIIYSVSHDLRNPIISVLGYLDVLSREHAGQLQGDGEHYLQRIAVNATYMQDLIQDLLELSRIGRSEPPPQAVALGDLAESVAQELRTQHPGCTMRVQGSFPVVWVSELRARQLLTNLMDNAAKYGEGGAVTVQAEQAAGGGARLTVCDDGKGIPEALREKAFDVFERLDAARTDIPGTGMGLPICKRIVDTLSGSISLGGPSGGRASGTTVTIDLPRSAVLGWSETADRVATRTGVG